MKAASRRYARAHKRWHWIILAVIAVVELVATLTIHEPQFHIGLLSGTTAWETFVMIGED